MNKIRKAIVFVLAIGIITAMSTAVFADSSKMNGGTYDFNGSAIVTEGTGSINNAVSGLEPGDDVTITMTYTNSTDDVTEWYMQNDIIKSLEDSSKAANGGYTYSLTNVGPDGTETEIFNSDAVGGNSKAAGEGLHQADNATDEWFFIQELKAGQSGKTLLHVALDGESQVNSYENTEAELTVSYAVEKKAEGETIYKHVNVKTGDNTRIVGTVAIFLASLILLILGFISRRKDRKEGVGDEN